MFFRALIRQPSSLRTIYTLAMQESRRMPANRHYGRRGKSTQQSLNRSEYSATAKSASNVASAAAPPLEIPVPFDTPRFSDLAKDNLVHPVLLQTISQDMKFDHMTPVQAATIYQLLQERRDILAQAKTGTGKTTAFLLPAIQSMINRQQKPGSSISLLVISPTRELALQIASEAQALIKRMPQYKVCTGIGGTNKNTEERNILRGCDILIGTPGRLLDHFLENGQKTEVGEKLRNLHTFVLDEADRLLDMGFLPDLKRIVQCIPNKQSTDRQTMLFSATVPDHVEKVSKVVFTNDDYKYISTITKGELSTHERVPQALIVVPNFSDIAAGLVGALRQEMHGQHEKFKTIVFCGTAALCEFYAELISQIPDMPEPIALHSRMSQSKRTRITNDYREAKTGLLIATDVIARGMDFPNVTNVFQVGIPSDKESYVHRLGRTARAGAEGRGTFIVTSHEAYFPKYTLKDITFVEEAADLTTQESIKQIAQKMDPQTQNKAYQAWLGYYKTSVKQLGWDTGRLVQEANKFALEGLGCAEIPTLAKSTVGKMGLKGVRGLVVGPDPPKQGRGGGSRAPRNDGGNDSNFVDQGFSNKRKRY